MKKQIKLRSGGSKLVTPEKKPTKKPVKKED
jgi:hypothetical protein